jgi:hypothetical protein
MPQHHLAPRALERREIELAAQLAMQLLQVEVLARSRDGVEELPLLHR